ncbi:MAG: 5-formyltetrahydrofolate cyclo-ligase [Leadbetterella sp.]
MLKADIRANNKVIRRSFTKEECALKNQKIHDLLFSRIPMHRYGIIHTFLPILSQNEPDTLKIVATLRKDFAPEIYIPRMESDRELSHIHWQATLELKKNNLGILEPLENKDGKTSEQFFTDFINEDVLILVPLLGFDKRGHRVGYGKGYYDQFVGEKTPKTTILGLSLLEVEEEFILDVGITDIPLDYCVSPERVYSF